MATDTVDESGPRVKFTCHRLGSLNDCLQLLMTDEERSKVTSLGNQMAEALMLSEQVGAAPVAADGKVAGNAAAVLARRQDAFYVLVSRSGRNQGEFSLSNDACIVTDFNHKEWSCSYYANNSNSQPTSDTPLHVAALQQTGAGVSLHGHEFESVEKASAAGLPCSHSLTLFSTPDDTSALVDLIVDNRQHRMFVRRGHGFVIVAEEFSEATELLLNKLKLLSNLNQ